MAAVILSPRNSLELFTQRGSASSEMLQLQVTVVNPSDISGVLTFPNSFLRNIPLIRNVIRVCAQHTQSRRTTMMLKFARVQPLQTTFHPNLQTITSRNRDCGELVSRRCNVSLGDDLQSAMHKSRFEPSLMACL